LITETLSPIELKKNETISVWNQRVVEKRDVRRPDRAKFREKVQFIGHK
jgi:hypothetical protein